MSELSITFDAPQSTRSTPQLQPCQAGGRGGVIDGGASSKIIFVPHGPHALFFRKSTSALSSPEQAHDPFKGALLIVSPFLWSVPPPPPPLASSNMPGGPIVSGNGGIGASAPKSPWAGIFMTVCASFSSLFTPSSLIGTP